MGKKQVPKQTARQLNDIGPHSNQREVEGLARRVALRIAQGEELPPEYDDTDYASMQFHHPMKAAPNKFKKFAAKGSL